MSDQDGVLTEEALETCFHTLKNDGPLPSTMIPPELTTPEWRALVEDKEMKGKVEVFLFTMLKMGLSSGQANEKTYEYALALLLDQEVVGSRATATIMERAVNLVKEAWTNTDIVHYCQEMRHQERARR